MIKAVVFDLDDTLYPEIDYVKSGFFAVATYLSETFGFNCDLVYEQSIKLFEEDSMMVFNRLIRYLNLEESESFIKELVNIYRNHRPQIEFYPDAQKILEELKARQVKTGLITDGFKETQRQKIKSLNIETYMNHIIVTDELGREFWKPHVKSYELMRNLLEVEFEEMIYVGDNVKKDFITANKLGIKTIQIKREAGIYQDVVAEEAYLPRRWISNLKEVLEEFDEAIS